MISIHTVLADCDSMSVNFPNAPTVFQSTQSSQTVTEWRYCMATYKTISIHTVLADCDPTILSKTRRKAMISIHTVLADCDPAIRDYYFSCAISIHTVLADCDGMDPKAKMPDQYFNPHSPRRLWRSRKHKTFIISYFNPHSPRRLWQLHNGL